MRASSALGRLADGLGRVALDRKLQIRPVAGTLRHGDRLARGGRERDSMPSSSRRRRPSFGPQTAREGSPRDEPDERRCARPRARDHERGDTIRDVRDARRDVSRATRPARTPAAAGANLQISRDAHVGCRASGRPTSLAWSLRSLVPPRSQRPLARPPCDASSRRSWRSDYLSRRLAPRPARRRSARAFSRPARVTLPETTTGSPARPCPPATRACAATSSSSTSSPCASGTIPSTVARASISIG